MHKMNTRSVQRALNTIMGHGAVINGEEPAMRVGSEYQAEVQPQVDNGDAGQNGIGSVLIWKPSQVLKNDDMEAYLTMALEKFGYEMEQALGLLYWHSYNIEQAVEDLPNFCPLQDEWSMEDKVIFEQAFQYHGKNFQRIRAMLPEKPISSLVKYYYLWKRTYSQYSLMDKHARRNGKRLSAGIPLSNDETESTQSGSSRSDSQVFHPPLTLPPSAIILGAGKGKQLPRGMFLSPNEMSALASDTEGTQLRRCDKEIVDLKHQIQLNKQDIMIAKNGGGVNIESLRPSDFMRKSGTTVPTRWNEEELRIALEVIHDHGKDYEAMANALEDKTVAQCRNFFTNYKRKLNLPRVIAEYEIRHGRKLSRYSRQTRDLPAESSSVSTQGVGPEVVGVVGPGEGLMEAAPPIFKRPRMSYTIVD